jgi:hypothetical protein
MSVVCRRATRCVCVAAGEEVQNMRDVLAYTSHSDPQLKGSTALLIGGLLKAVLTQARGSFTKWTASLGTKGTTLTHLK